MYYALASCSFLSSKSPLHLVDLLLSTLCNPRTTELYMLYISLCVCMFFVRISVRIFRLLSHCFHFEINNALSCASCSININQRPFVSSHSRVGPGSAGYLVPGLCRVWESFSGHGGSSTFPFAALMKVIY